MGASTRQEEEDEVVSPVIVQSVDEEEQDNREAHIGLKPEKAQSEDLQDS